MHNHQVYFWLNENLSDPEILAFEKGLESLTTISLVENGYFGKPADTHRSIVDRSYSYGLTLQFNSIIEHDQYQNHPTHQDFVASNSRKWKKVLIYDVQTPHNK